MAHGRDKYQSRESRSRVREILLHEWDPIGVSGVPQAADEYDSYADKVYVMLMYDGAGAAEIAAYLFQVANVHMGLSYRAELAGRCDKVAERLVSLRPEFLTQ
jgi:hypothetical protein